MPPSVSDDDSDDEAVVDTSIIASGLAVGWWALNVLDKTPQYTDGMRGARLVRELLDGHPLRLYEFTRLDRHCFEKLHTWLLDNTDLKGSQYMSSKEKLLIFLYIAAHGVSFRNACEVFQHSKETIHRYDIFKIIYYIAFANQLLISVFHMLLQALVKLHTAIVRLPKPGDPIPPKIVEQTASRNGLYYRFWPYFQDCVGALDGSHIPAWVPGLKQAAWRNRKGFLSQNILAVCNFDMEFVYVLAGWEGTAHDVRVLNNALEQGLSAPPGKYYLGDAGYSNTPITLVPYRGARYHLKETIVAGLKPQNKEELFNLRHASLRNVIERIFGVLKRRWRILQSAPELHLRDQAGLVYALTAIHNFIQQNSEDSELLETLVDEELDYDAIQRELEELAEGVVPGSEYYQENSQMKEIRDRIAQAMWDDYIQSRSSRWI